MRKIYPAGLLLALASPALAGTLALTFQVGATITPGCAVTSGTGGVLGTMNFGTWTGVQNVQVSTSFIPNLSLSIACTPGVALSMAIDGGQHFTTVRNMVRNGGSNPVPYRLYSTSAMSAGSELVAGQAQSISYSNSNNITLPIYGTAQLTGFSPAGTYTDQLTVTLSW